jgi:hypothetical protein
MLLPFVFSIWMIGWTLFCVGNRGISRSQDTDEGETQSSKKVEAQHAERHAELR